MKQFKEIDPSDARGIKIVLMDIDDTLTKEGKLLPESFSALWRLKERGYKVVPITGRPAGWCDMIARQWPVDGVVGENGALAFWLDEDARLKQAFHPLSVRPLPGGILDRIRERALAEVPGCRIAKDQFSRIFDIAIDFAEEPPLLGLEEARKIKGICEGLGARAKISSIHVNAWVGDYDKLSMTELFLSSRFGWDPIKNMRSVLFFGDSPNDEPMFRRFPLSCGVANIKNFISDMEYLPKFVTNSGYGYGFAESITYLCNIINI